MIDTLNFIEDLKEIRKSMPYTNITSELVDFKPDLVLIAQQLEGEDSSEAAKMIRLHETYFNTPIIFLLEEESSSQLP